MSEPAFSNIKAVHAHLADLGYKRGQSTIYQDAKDGLLRPTGEGGIYTLDDVERYIKAARIKKPGAIDTKSDAWTAQKRKAELEDLQERAALRRLARREKEGTLIDRAQVESDLADRARLLRAGLHNWARREVDAMIALAGGDPVKAPEVLAAWEQAVDDELDRYARAGRIDLEQPL
jgi:hypothetical protein